MDVIVSVLGYNLVMGNADIRSPCLLHRPLCVGKDNNCTEFAVYPHYEPLQFCSKCCHALNVDDDRFPPIEFFPAMLTNFRLMFVASGLSSPSVITVNS